MKKAVIFYQSETGTTKRYAQEIGTYLQTKQIQTTCLHVKEYSNNLLEHVDYLFLGCWTKGLMIIFQKPDEIWNNFAKRISIPMNTQLALFATYKIRTGSMFKNMLRRLNQLGTLSIPKLKSRNGELTADDKTVLDQMVFNG